MKMKQLNSKTQRRGPLGITERQTQVLSLIATGIGYKEVSMRLEISHRTLDNHIAAIKRNLHIHNGISSNCIQFTHFALHHKLIKNMYE